MTDRNRTYISFYADKKTEPNESDIKYYELLTAWNEMEKITFEYINSSVKANALTDTGAKDTLIRSIQSSLKQSKNILLIIGKTTNEDMSWIPLEISYAVDECAIPVIAAYIGYKYILDPSKLSHLWPQSLKSRIENNNAKVIHIPFVKEPLFTAMLQFDNNNYPEGGLSYYSRDAYAEWNLIPDID